MFENHSKRVSFYNLIENEIYWVIFNHCEDEMVKFLTKFLSFFLACLKAKNNTLRRRNSSGFQRSTLNFCFEDMTTDSTSVLKDCRHPSLSSVHLSSSSSKPSGPTIGRVVSLHRTNTTISVQPSIRPRYLSEGHEASKMNSKDNLHSSKLFICTPTATAATNDNVFQNSHKSGSSLCVSMDFEFQSIVGLAPAASIVVDNAAEGALEVKLLI